MASVSPHLQARYDTCRFCLFSRRWGTDESGVVWVCVKALNDEIADVEECGGRSHFVVRPGREEDFANRLERPATDASSPTADVSET